jgi:hypothetical protein
MVLGNIINQVNDVSGKITVSVWKATDPPLGTPPWHHNFEVEVGSGWACIGGGGTGRERVYKGSPSGFPNTQFVEKTTAVYLTGSFPSSDDTGQPDWKGWRILARDHIEETNIDVYGYAIAIKHEDLTRDELISNLRVFKGVGNPVQHPDMRVYVEQGFLLVGGGFNVIDIDPAQGGGNIGSGSFPDSTISWRARSQDIQIPTKSTLEVFAIGIRENLKKPNPGGPSIGKFITSFSSDEKLNPPPDSPGNVSPVSIARPLPGFVLCGGGGAAHPSVSGSYLYALEPPTLENPPNIPPPRILDPFFEQTFTASSTSYNEKHTVTAYAMGIKFEPLATGPGPGPGTQCDRIISITEAKSDVTLNPTALPEDNVKDGNLNTMWMSKNVQNPSIRVALVDQKPICKVDIAWGDGSARVYKFFIEVSTDNQNWGIPVFTGQSTGTTTDYETYPVNGDQAKWMRVTVTDSGLGTGNSIAQISEIRVFSNV